MDAEQLTKLQESIDSQKAINARLLERALRGDARELAQTILKPLTLHEAVKLEVVENVLRTIPRTEVGEIDATKFTESVNAEAKRLGALAATLIGSGRPTGMGAPAPVEPAVDAKEAERSAARSKQVRESAVRNFTEAFGMDPKAAEAAADRMLVGEVA